MVYFLRLILAVFFVLLSGQQVLAQSVPKVSSFKWTFGGGSGTSSTFGGACSAGVAKLQSLQSGVCSQPNPGCSYTTISNAQTGECAGIRNGSARYDIPISVVSVCPQGYTENAKGTCDPPPAECVAPLKKDASGKCSCPAGTTEGKDSNGLTQCKPANFCAENKGKFTGSGVQLDYGQRSADQLGRMVGNDTNGCHSASGCVIQGIVAGCWGVRSEGSAGCLINTPTYTGEKCSETDNTPQQCPSGSRPSEYAAGVCIPDEKKCPAGSTPSQYAEGVCIPDENKCPSGQSPSKYAAGVCVPNEDPNADGNNETGKPTKCPPGRVESRYVSGLCIPADTTVGDGNGGGGSTTCKDGKCTTTDDDGNSEEEPQDEFCKKNPDSPQCKKSNFGGSCGSFICDGDAIQCAIAKEQHKRSCKLFDDKSPESELYEKEKGKEGNQTKELPGNETNSIQGKIDTSDAIGGGSVGVQDLNIVVWGKSVTLPFSQVNSVLDALGRVLLAVSFLLAIRIVSRG